MTSAHLEHLLEQMVIFAQKALVASDSDFRPFGATLEGSRELQLYAADDDPEDDFKAQILKLKQYLKQISEGNEIYAAGICCDVIVHNEGKSSQDAIHCSLESDTGEAYEHFIPYVRSEGGTILYGQAVRSHRARQIFGLTGAVLTLENQTPIQSPTVKQILGSVDALTPQGGPGFLIVESATKDYVQAAGGDERFTVEWREYLDDGFKHWVAGLETGSEKRDVKIKTNGCVVTVQANEVLSSDDAKQILEAFGKGKGRPATYEWRDTTATFV